MIELRALGSAEIHTDSTTITPSQEIVFAAALYMIMERGKKISRSRLASLLWPRVAQKDQTHRFRQTVYQLKKLGVQLRSDRNVVEFADVGVRTDFDDVSMFKIRVPTQNDLLEFLPGYAPNLSDEFQDWLDRVRETVHSTLTRTL